ncbi:hypothetical protein BV898_07935 [Hypsibius exemplaris]|uniref:Homeobox domain-containing protein n=1 Tax=Hypsibius exemplaris TaxID=2072580 RepID=A0A1W0WS70_HYPEX|nr:hypothetical protein BV898_07935 [Hypsibius exemplaris]
MRGVVGSRRLLLLGPIRQSPHASAIGVAPTALRDSLSKIWVRLTVPPCINYFPRSFLLCTSSIFMPPFLGRRSGSKMSVASSSTDSLDSSASEWEQTPTASTSTLSPSVNAWKDLVSLESDDDDSGSDDGDDSCLFNFTVPKKTRRLFTPEQNRILIAHFGVNPQPEPSTMSYLEGVLKMSNKQVKSWFANRRNRMKIKERKMVAAARIPTSHRNVKKRPAQVPISRRQRPPSTPIIPTPLVISDESMAPADSSYSAGWNGGGIVSCPNLRELLQMSTPATSHFDVSSTSSSYYPWLPDSTPSPSSMMTSIQQEELPGDAAFSPPIHGQQVEWSDPNMTSWFIAPPPPPAEVVNVVGDMPSSQPYFSPPPPQYPMSTWYCHHHQERTVRSSTGVIGFAAPYQPPPLSVAAFELFDWTSPVDFGRFQTIYDLHPEPG